MKILLVIGCALAPSLVLAAQFGDSVACDEIKNASKRLVCYDQRSRPAKAAELNKAKEVEEQRLLSEKTKQARTEAIVSAKVAVRALKKLDNRLNIGVSYRDYPGGLADAADSVSEFHESKHALILGATDKATTEAMRHYKKALDVWRRRFDREGGKETVLIMFDTANFVNDLQYEYPDMVGAIFVTGGWGGGDKRFSFPVALSIIWRHASEALAEAETSIRDAEEAEKSH